MKIDVEKKVKIRSIVDMFFIITIPFICVSGVSALPWKIRTPLIYLVGIVAVIYAILSNVNIRLNTITCLFFLFWLYLVVSVPSSIDKQATLSYVYIYLSVFPLLFIDFSDNVCEKIINVMLIYAVVIAISIVISVPIENCMDRYFWFIVNPSRNEIVTRLINFEVARHSYSGLSREIANAAFIMNVGIAIQLSKFLSNTKDFKAKDISISILLVVALLLTGKRMMIVVVALAFCAMMLVADVRGKTGKNIIIGITAVLSLIMILMFIPELANTFLRFTDAENLASMGSRDILWDHAYAMIEKFWLFGGGFGSYNAYSYSRGMTIAGQKWVFHNHNIYYQILGELGIIGGLILFSFLILAMIKTAILMRNKMLDQHQKKIIGFSFYIQFMLLVYGISGNPIYTTEIIYTWMFAISIYLSVASRFVKVRSKENGFRRYRKKIKSKI